MDNHADQSFDDLDIREDSGSVYSPNSGTDSSSTGRKIILVVYLKIHSLLNRIIK